MSEILKRIFPNGIGYGSGIACGASALSAMLVLDFYDGATEGFARIGETDNIVYFKKIWWDEHQDNRLFDGLVFPAAELKKLDEKLFELIAGALATKDSMGRPTDVRAPLPADLFEVVQKLSVLRVNIFCVQITRDLFILPATV